MKTIWLAFGAIFLAELGDKTQLAVLAMKSKGWSSVEVFIGAMIAFAILTGLALIVGEWLNANLPTNLIERVAAGGFVIIGILMWFGKL